MTIRNELVEELLVGRDPSEVFRSDGLPDELKKALAERMLNAELDQYLASERAGASGEVEGARNYCNGSSRKTVLTGIGKLELQVPCDLRRAPDPSLAGICVLEGTPGGCGGAEANLPGTQRRTGAGGAGGLCRRPMACPLPGSCPRLAPAMGEQVIPFYAYPLEVRRMIHTTNAVESLNSCLRKAVRLRGHFPTDEAAAKLLFLALREVSRTGRCERGNGAWPGSNSRLSSVIASPQAEIHQPTLT